MLADHLPHRILDSRDIIVWCEKTRHENPAIGLYYCVSTIWSIMRHTRRDFLAPQSSPRRLRLVEYPKRARQPAAKPRQLTELDQVQENRQDAEMQTITIRPFLLLVFVAALGHLPALGVEPESSKPAEVKVAAVQMLGYDKTDLPRPGFHPSETVVQYIQRRRPRTGLNWSCFLNIFWAGFRSLVLKRRDFESSGGWSHLRHRRLLGSFQRRLLRQHGTPV